VNGSRAELVRLIDALARAGWAGDHQLIEKRRREAVAFASVVVPAPTASHSCPECDLRFGSEQRLAEHEHRVHDGPEPAHWREEAERDA
jgi:hypothetical protein